MVVWIEASLQQLGHFVHLIMLDEIHELPQIGLRKTREERESYYSEKEKNKRWWVWERKSQDRAANDWNRSAARERCRGSNITEGEKWKCLGIQCEIEGDSLLKMEEYEEE